MPETTENERDEGLSRKIRGFDLFAREARFHSSCHMLCQRNQAHLNLSKLPLVRKGRGSHSKS